MTLRTICLLILAAVMVTGCSRTATLQLRGTAPLNLNEAGESTPVDVRIYQLRSDKAFRKAAFEKLWTKDKEALGDDLLAGAKTVSVLPGGAGEPPARVELGELATGTGFIGIMALYGKADAKDNRTLVVAVDDAEKYVIEFTGYAVALREQKPAAAAEGKPESKSR
jgi:type VI secretion system VasD/TssJ family lipoprotein